VLGSAPTGPRHTAHQTVSAPPAEAVWVSSGGSWSLLRGLPDLVGHPLAEIAVSRLGFALLHKRDAGPAVRHAAAIENGEVHQRVVENVRDDRGERLSAVDMGKAPFTCKAGRREQDDAADSRENLSHGSITFDESFGCLGGTAAPEMIWNDCPAR
jgi:hypothetical protein